MEKKSQPFEIPQTLVTSKIYIVRNKKIMLDRDLAELYEVETRVLNQSVNRNIEVRVERFVTSPLPRRSGRAAFPHPVPQHLDLL